MDKWEVIKGELDKNKNVNPIALNSTWPQIIDNQILTEEFLLACKPVVIFIESLGKLFSPVKNDVEGNLRKLEGKYNEEKEANKYLQTMLLNEKGKGGNFSIDALLWLKRGLHFIYLILYSIVDDFKKGVNTESMQANCRRAYDAALRPHHNFVVQKLFVVLNHSIPNRKGIYNCLIRGANIPEEEIINQLVPFVEGLRTNLEFINEFYVKNGFDKQVKLNL